MAPKVKSRVVDSDNIQGLKYFRQIQPLLARLHEVGIDRDRAGNRQLFFDQYAALILLFFFNPSLDSLRSLQRASQVDKVQKKLNCRSMSIGSLSAAARDFDAEPLQAIVGELAEQTLPLAAGKDAEVLRGLTAVDGSLLPALPKMVWALWIDDQHRAAKMHLHFDVFKSVPCHATLTNGNGDERKELRATLQSDRLYVIDRGYAEYQLFQDIIDKRSNFIGRLRANAVYEVVEERPLSEDAHAAGILHDYVVKLGCEASCEALRQCVRVVEVATGKTNSQGHPEVLLLASSCMDIDAAWIALGYRYRWTIELFFRWFKCILGCQHLLSTNHNGLLIQVYMALIVSVLIVQWTGQKPSKPTLEMLCLYFQGWASEKELITHLRNEAEKRKKKAK